MIEIIQYKSVNVGTLRAVISINIPKWGDFIINDISCFSKGDQRWISFPCKTYEKDGAKKFFPNCRFKDQNMTKAFQDKVFESLEKYLKEHPETNQTEIQFPDGEIPF